MRVYLVRHGEAADGSTFEDDAARPLTNAGEAELQQVARCLRRLAVCFGYLLTSPLLRARQTADILLAAGLADTLAEDELLAPPGDFDAFLRWLAAWQKGHGGDLALIGHQPTLGQWGELLLWEAAAGKLPLKKAGIAGIQLPDRGSPVGRSELFWFTSPRLLLGKR